MANTKSAAKRARQTETRTLDNSRAGTQVKSAKRKLRDLIKAGDKAGAAEAYKQVSSVLDRAAKRGVRRQCEPQQEPPAQGAQGPRRLIESTLNFRARIARFAPFLLEDSKARETTNSHELNTNGSVARHRCARLGSQFVSNLC